MIPTDPTFAADFDANLFRSAIRSTMELGFPVNVDLQPTFRWTTKHTYTSTVQGGKPLDMFATPATTTSHDDVIVPVAVEVGTATVSGTALGQFNEATAKITVLDVDYDLVDTADQIVLGGNSYKIVWVEPDRGLRDVTVYTLHCSAWDES